MHEDGAENKEKESSWTDTRLRATVKNDARDDTKNTEQPEAYPKDPIEETERALKNVLIFLKCAWLWVGKRHDQIVAIGTVGILIATSVYAVFSYRQWSTSKT